MLYITGGKSRQIHQCVIVYAYNGVKGRDYVYNEHCPVCLSSSVNTHLSSHLSMPRKRV